MQKKSPVLRGYLLRFCVRLGVALTVFIVWRRTPAALDFTKGGVPAPVLLLLWGALVCDFACQLSPRARVSRGCLKQFAELYVPAQPAADAAQLRMQIRALNRGAVKVAAVWAAPNLLFAALYFRGIFGVPEMVLLTAFYYLCDVVCILFWCPFQKLLMKNKCCTACRIFAWGTIMTVTPLLFVPHPYAWTLVGLAAVCTVRWEMTYHRRPERFCEASNAALRCAACTDRLCQIKRALERAVR